MCCRGKAIKLLLNIKKGWKAVAKDSEGQSSGLIAIWEPYRASFNAYSFFGGILLEGYIRGKSEPLYIINMYAPYVNR